MAGPTSFHSPALKLVPFIAATALCEYFTLHPVIGSLLFMFVARRSLNKEPTESPVAMLVKTIVLSVVWVGCSVLCTWVPLALFFGSPLTGWYMLVSYLPLVLMLHHKRDQPYSLAGCVVLHVLWDVPLVLAGLILREIFGIRLFAPFATIFDDDIVQGSMPFPSDVATLAGAPYNVGAVVNMCMEYSGPTSQYDKHGITQLRLPVRDTTSPPEEALRRGAEFIASQLAKNKDKRVYVHCKGGIARASTMALAHYVLNKKEDPAISIERMAKLRFVVYKDVAGYQAIRNLVAAQ